jgi:hypothetical protein
MHQHQVLAAGGETLADTGHLILAMVTVALMYGRVRTFRQAATGLEWRRDWKRPAPANAARMVTPGDTRGHQDANGSYVSSTGKRSSGPRQSRRPILSAAAVPPRPAQESTRT